VRFGGLEFWSDRGHQAMVVLVAAAAAGFVALGLAWAGVAGRLYVGLQMPFVVSGAFGGVALAGASLTIAGIHYERRHNATERFHFDQMIREVTLVSESLPEAIPAATPADVPREQAAALVTNGRTVHRAECRMAAGKDLPPAGTMTDLRPCGICKPSLGLPSSRRP
jgi:hypothetical protein